MRCGTRSSSQSGRHARWGARGAQTPRWFGWLGGVLIALFAVRAEAQLADSEQLLRADQLYQRGRRAMFAERWTEAHQILSEAWALKQSYDIGALLGQTELNLQMYPEAAEHLAYALRNYPARDPVEPRHRLEQGFAIAQARTATVYVRGNVAGATVTVDGRELGVGPLPHPLFLAPGTHQFAASRHGYRTVEVTRTMAAGSTTEITLDPSPEAVAEPLVASGPTLTVGADAGRASSSASARQVVLLVGSGLTLVAGGTSAYFALRSSSLRDEEDELRAELGGEPGVCEGVASSRCEDLRQTRDDRADAAMGSRIALAVATGVGLATAATFFFWKTEPAAPQLAAWWTRDGAGLAAGGRF